MVSSSETDFINSVKLIKKQIIDSDYCDGDITIAEEYGRSKETLNGYITLDWDHRVDISEKMNVINNYIHDKTRRRPLNILMVAPPGSGKSHFVKCLAAGFGDPNITAVEFNMASLHNPVELEAALVEIRNIKVIDRIPLLFLDEFDSREENITLLLPLLWDGELVLGRNKLRVGKVVIILAGSSRRIETEIARAKKLKNFSKDAGHSKWEDFISRINGGIIRIPDLESHDAKRDRRVDKIFIAIDLIKRRFPSVKCVSFSFCHFIGRNIFRYGVRSLEHLVDCISPTALSGETINSQNMALKLNSDDELKNSSLAFHLVAKTDIQKIINGWKEGLSRKGLVKIAV